MDLNTRDTTLQSCSETEAEEETATENSRKEPMATENIRSDEDVTVATPSSSLITGIRQVLEHAQLVALQETQAKRRESLLQERVRLAEAEKNTAQEMMKEAQVELCELRRQVAEGEPKPVAA